jgi:hypothetical protein
VQASRLASLPPAHLSDQLSGKAKCYHSITKNGNGRNLSKSVRIHSKKLTSVSIYREGERAKLVYLVVAFSLSLLQCCQSAKLSACSVGERERAKPACLVVAFFFFLRLRVDSPKSVRIHSKKLTCVSIHSKKCVPICWLIWLGQGVLCVQASRLTSLPPAHQSGPSGKEKCYHSLTKNRNVRNLTKEHISRPGHPRAVLTPPTSCQSAREKEGGRERAKLVYLVVAFSLLQCCASAIRRSLATDRLFSSYCFESIAPQNGEKWAKKYNCASIIQITSAFRCRRPENGRRRRKTYCFESIALQNGEKWVEKYNCASNIQKTKLLSFFSGKKPPTRAFQCRLPENGRRRRRKTYCFDSIALQNGEKWVKKYNCASNIQITKLLYVFSVKKLPISAFRRRRPENGRRRRKTKTRLDLFRYGAAAAATLRTRHKQGRKGGSNSGQVNMAVHCVNVRFLVPGRARAILTHANEWQHSNIYANLQLFSFQEGTSRAAAAAVLTRGQTQSRKSVNAELTNCKNSGLPEEKKKSVDMYTIVCASIDKLTALAEILHARSLLPVRRTELLMCANNVLDRTAKVAVYDRVKSSPAKKCLD